MRQTKNLLADVLSALTLLLSQYYSLSVLAKPENTRETERISATQNSKITKTIVDFVCAKPFRTNNEQNRAPNNVRSPAVVAQPFGGRHIASQPAQSIPVVGRSIATVVGAHNLTSGRQCRQQSASDVQHDRLSAFVHRRTFRRQLCSSPADCVRFANFLQQQTRTFVQR